MELATADTAGENLADQLENILIKGVYWKYHPFHRVRF